VTRDEAIALVADILDPVLVDDTLAVDIVDALLTDGAQYGITSMPAGEGDPIALPMGTTADDARGIAGTYTATVASEPPTWRPVGRHRVEITADWQEAPA
jgi:hypothetical protein